MTDVLVISALDTVRAGLVALLARVSDLTVVRDARSLDAAGLTDFLPDVDVVLFDATSSSEVLEAAAILDGAGPGLLALGPADGARRLSARSPAFTWGYLARDASADRIIAGVRAVAYGLIVFDADLSLDAVFAHGTAEVEPLRDTPDGLTPREQEVLSLVAVGLTNKAIAQRLAISDHTVKFHVAAVLAKLNAESRTEAVHSAFRRGLLAL